MFKQKCAQPNKIPFETRKNSKAFEVFKIMKTLGKIKLLYGLNGCLYDLSSSIVKLLIPRNLIDNR